MKYSIQFSDAIHILAYIEIFKNTNLLSSEIIAGSVKTNPANIRKIMSNLKKSNLITTQTGKANPILARPPEEISLLDVYKSIEGNTNLIHVDPKPIQTALSEPISNKFLRVNTICSNKK